MSSNDTARRGDSADDEGKPDEELYVVGIGASAGGLAAFKEFFEALPADTGMAYVVVQHLAPAKHSELPAILGRWSEMEVELIGEATRLEANHVYVIPPDKTLTIEGNTLELGQRIHDEHRHLVIDRFLDALSKTKDERAVGIILSGTQSDGTRGVMAIKERGGLVLVQSPEEAEYPSMPQNAIKTGRVDLILPAAELAERLAAFEANQGRLDRSDILCAGDDDSQEGAYMAIVDQLRRVTGHDFSHYKRSTMVRRIDRRRSLHGLDDLQAYAEFLDDHRAEVEQLFDEVLITVTRFFRNQTAFEVLKEEVITRLFDEQESGKPIRIWVPGCATGEEVYSIAMLMEEVAEERKIRGEYKIFATDLDRRAISQARKGIFSAASCERLSKERLERFFVSQGDGFRVRGELRDRVLFAVHDILQDPPFARQDLVSCRNLLIYLDREAQRRVFEVIYYSLGTKGYLFLGASEFLGDASNLFTVIDKSERIFQSEGGESRIVSLSNARGLREMSGEGLGRAEKHRQTPATLIGSEHYRMLSEKYAPPSLVVDENYDIIHIVGDSQYFLRVPSGPPTTALFKTIIPQLRLPLRTALIEAFDQGQTTTTGEITFEREASQYCLRIVVRVIEERHIEGRKLAQIVFENVDEMHETAETLIDVSSADPSFQRVIERVEAENERLSEELYRTIERYETTTEELKTSNEELLTINEELQSTTEELETSKEELQSTNEELITVNDELGDKIGQLDEVNNDLKNLLASTQIGTIFLDRALKIRRFTAPVKKYFNLIDADVGRPVEHVTHQLQYDGLVHDLRGVLDDLQPRERELRSENDHWFIMRVLPYRTVDERIDGVVVTFFDITDRKEVQRRLEERELLFRTVFESASDGLFLYHLDEQEGGSNFTEVNESVCRRLGYDQQTLSLMSLADLVDPKSIDLDAYFFKLRQIGQAVEEVRFVTRSGKMTEDEISSRLFTVAGEPTVLTISRDIGPRKAYEDVLISAKEESERLAELRATFLANMSHEIRTPLTSIIGVSQLLQKKDLPEKHSQMVRLIQTSGRRLQQTLDSVLDISRIEAGEMSPRYKRFDLVSQIEDDVEMLRPLADRRGLSLEFHCPQGEFYFWTDVGFLHRIVYNLVENGIKFTEEGTVSVSLEPGDGQFELVVSDTGIGIGEEFLPHLFDKFKQASIGTGRSYDGSGLGMALVKHLTDLMEGSIDVESQPGKGTTFSIVIPEHRHDE